MDGDYDDDRYDSDDDYAAGVDDAIDDDDEGRLQANYQGLRTGH